MNYREISLKSLLACIINKLWIVAAAAVLFGTAAYFITSFMIVPQYKATIRLYVNNKTEATSSVTSSDVSAAKSLVDTYITIIKSDFVIDDIAKRARINDQPERIKRMISAKAVNGTEVFDVSVTGPWPEECAVIANLAAELAPSKISKVVDGSSVKIIDRAKIPEKPISPNTVRNIAAASMLGIVLSCVLVILEHLLNTVIYSEDDIKEFCRLPILGIFPNFDKAAKAEHGNSYGGRGKSDV